MRFPIPQLRRPDPPEPSQWPPDLRRMPDPPATEPTVPLGVRLAASYAWRMLIIAAAVYVVARAIGYFSEIAIPFFVAVLLSALLQPARRLMISARFPGGLATAITMIGTLTVIIGLLALTGTQLVNGLGDLGTEVGKGLERVQVWLRDGPLHLSSGQVQDYLDQLQNQLVANREKLVSYGLSGFTTAGAALTGFVLAMFCLIFLLHDGRGVWNWVIGLMPAEGRQRLDLAGRRGWVTLTSYVRATLVVAAVDGLGIGVGAALLGVPLAIPIGVLTFLAAFIPMIGAILSGAVAVLVALVALGLFKALLMLAVVLAVQQLESHVLQPLLLGRAVHLHPLGVVISLGAGFVVAGIVGGVFAVPLMAFLNSVRRSLQDHPQYDSSTPDGSYDAPLAVDGAEPREPHELTDAALVADTQDTEEASADPGKDKSRDSSAELTDRGASP